MLLTRKVQEMKQYYKVVRVKRDKLVSSVMGGRSPTQYFQRTYSAALWTRGVKGTPVMAFDSLAEARRFAESRLEGRHDVWLAEVRQPRRLNRLMYVFSGKANMLRFWGLIQPKQWWRIPSALDGYFPSRCPDGTVACEAIRLVRKVS